MSETPHYLRLYTGFEPESDPVSPHVLATRELLRPPVVRAERPVEPFTRSWYEELEWKRYQRQGAWLPRWLEFSRHAGESILILGPGLGTDAIQYHRNGVKPTVVVTPEDPDDRLAEHMALRDLDLPIMHVKDFAALPIARGCFDLVFWNALHSHADLQTTIKELHRVLKPGGKLFALFPAKRDLDRWQHWTLPLRKYYREKEPRPSTGPKRTGAELKQAMKLFETVRIGKRLLRRSELPHVWRWLPMGLLEYLMGRVLTLRAFKPVNSTRYGIAAAA